MTELINCINHIPGIIEPNGSSNNESSISIWFKIHKDYSNILILFGRVMSRNYGGFETYNPYWPAIPTDNNDLIIGGGWKITLSYTDLTQPILDGYILFRMDSGMYKGEVALNQSKLIAENINSHLKHKSFLDDFGITPILRDEKIKQLIN